MNMKKNVVGSLTTFLFLSGGLGCSDASVEAAHSENSISPDGQETNMDAFEKDPPASTGGASGSGGGGPSPSTGGASSDPDEQTGTGSNEGTGGSTVLEPTEPGPKGPLKIVWRATSSVTINTGAGDFNYDIDWDNDGFFDELGVTGSVTHAYASSGDHTVAIQGQFPHMEGNCDIDIIQWGSVVWGSMRGMFDRCSGTTISASDTPDLSEVTDMSFMFARSAVEFGPEAKLGNWDTSNIRSLSNTFRHSSNFNEDVSGWDTSNVIDMSLTFWKAFAFNHDISGWDTSKVTNMRIMFQNARAFNQDLGDWDVTKVTSMDNMFGASAMDTASYDASLIGWASQSGFAARSLVATGRTYCDAVSARSSLISAGWTIQGDSLQCD